MRLERWTTFSKRDQLRFIQSEFERARVWEERGDNEHVLGALERALAFLDLSLKDSQWFERRYALLVLRDVVARRYVGDANGGARMLCTVL